MNQTKNTLAVSVVCLFLFLNFSCSQDPFKAEISVNKSPNDDRQYELLILPNKLKVLLVSDPEAEKSAASLSVSRGSLHDPDDRPGLAHFFEHMLFIGTEKYPEVDSFQNYISANGGGSNAYTAGDHTNYFFDIKNSAFKEGLDRFANFFIAPLLSDEYVEREKNAVHSEYQMQRKEDNWRQFMVSKSAMNPAYTGSKFSIGSLDTLAGEVKKDLTKFQQTHYSADQMGAVVLSNESIKEMRIWISPLFSQIPNRDIGEDSPQPPVVLPKELPITLSSKPLKENYQVEYTFMVPSIIQSYDIKPDSYISNLLGHEGSGSLHALLTEYGWIESLSAGSGSLDRENSAITISLSLTKSGAKNIPKISSLLFQYIALLKEEGPKEWLYKEQAIVANLAFEFQEKGGALPFVSGLAPKLRNYPVQDLISSSYLMRNFDDQLISKYLEHLNQDSVMIEIIVPDADTDQIEPWFNVPYSLNKNHIELSPVKTTKLFLPKKNPYLPENLSLLPDDTKPLERSSPDENLRIWLDQDLEFETPKANLYLRINFANALFTATDRVFAQMYRSLVSDALSESVYPAYLAGLGQQLSVSDTGYEVRLSGFSDKQLVLLETVMMKLTSTKIQPARFQVLKSTLIRKWLNSSKDYPYRQTMNAASEILVSNRWPSTDLARITENISIKQLEEWKEQKFKGVSVDALLHGNVNEETNEKLKRLLTKYLALAKIKPKKPELTELNRSVLLELEIDHDDASMFIYLQDGDDEIRTRAITSLAGQMLRTPYFSDLRTDQQLGYVVNAGSRMIQDRNGLVFMVQSPAQAADYLEEATNKFLSQYLDELPKITKGDFLQYKDGLVNNLTQKDKNLGQRSQRYWTDLKKGNLQFNTRQQLADAVESLDLSDITSYLLNVQTQLKKERLLVFSRGKFNSSPQMGEKIQDSKAFKRSISQ